jgi:hypothetical protein
VLTLTKVVGSSAVDPSQECQLAPATSAFALSQVNLVSVGVAGGDAGEVSADDAVGFGVAVGGRRGQVWVGPSFSQALPLFLERTPLAFGTLPGTDGGTLVAALTDRYLAAPRGGEGYEVIDVHRVTDTPLPAGAVVSALVGQAEGYGILSTADLVRLGSVSEGASSRLQLTFGPRLLDARGAPARGPYFAEAVRDFADGGLISLVMTADDSLYFAPAPQTASAPEALPPLSPQLTPAPSSPIRSLALERSAVGTNGVDRARGYLITARTLFVFQLAGSPPRWSAQPVVLQGGEPVETWMDHPLGGLGRVGYRDGQVFTLPGGFLLVNELPRGDGGLAPQVLDYENLAGWPVAMTPNGLFVAQWDSTDGGRLDNRFADGGVGKAMNWRERSLPDGGRPWLGKSARLQVVQRHTVLDARALKVFHLLVYTDEEVYDVATLTRP